MKKEFYKHFRHNEDTELFKVPGRLEIGGNHTDHNGGYVLSAPIDTYCSGLASKRKGTLIRVYSEGYGMYICDIKEPKRPVGFGALIEGVVDAFRKNNCKVGGLDMYVTSDIPSGGGLSSSAAFGVLMGRVLNAFYNRDKIKPLQIAKAAQYAEREFYGKPCGLMDQLTCAYACPILTDFAKEKVQRVEVSLTGYDIVLVDTLSSHEGLDSAYAAIPQDMKSVAALLGKEDLHTLTRKKILKKSGEIREKCGDRALLRALHFVSESERAKLEAQALEIGDIKEFLRLVRESGHSSSEYLQNTFIADSEKQPIMLALNIAQDVLGENGAYRVHGGGFAGAILVISPQNLTDTLKKQMRAVFGKNCIKEINIG